MRLGAFLLGGLVGAAAAIYFSDRQNRSMFFSANALNGKSLGNMWNNSKNRIMNTAMNAFMGGKTEKEINADSATAQDGLNKVEDIVKQDPALKNTVNDILADSGKTKMSIQ
jgi:gas vesicle protein